MGWFRTAFIRTARAGLLTSLGNFGLFSIPAGSAGTAYRFYEMVTGFPVAVWTSSGTRSHCA